MSELSCGTRFIGRNETLDQIRNQLHPDGPGALTAARSPVKARPVGSDPAFIRPAHVRWLSKSVLF